ncbi:MAG TPA: DHA2 family efflux MFS transporter permease subunit [Acidimicrobiales bacterium]
MTLSERVQARAEERRWLILGVLCFSLLVIVLDNSILNVALPSIVKELGATNTQLQWIVDSYTLVFAGLLLTAGSLGDRFGRRPALQFGFAIFGLGSWASAMASSPTTLIFSRGFMGIGGAFIMPATLSIITNVFPARERGKAIGIWAATAGLGAALGPLTGGFLLEHFYWGSVFLVNLPIVVFGLVAGVFLIPDSKDPSAPRLDPVGAVLSIIGLAMVLFAIIEAPRNGWTDPVTVVCFLVGAAVLGGFAWWELHSSHPMLDFNFFRNPRFSAASTAITLTFFAMFGSLFLFSQYLQFVLGYTPLQTGIRLLAVAIPMMIVAPLSPRFVHRFGTKYVVAAGMTLSTIALLVLSLLKADSSYPQLVWRLVILSCGLALTMAPATESIMGSLPLAKAGVGSAVNDTTRQVGGALGVAVLGSVFNSIYTSSVTDGLSGSSLPADAIAAAKDSVGGALGVAASVGGAVGNQVAQIAKDAFVDGLQVASRAGALVTLIGVVVTLLWLPARARDHDATMQAGEFAAEHPELGPEAPAPSAASRSASSPESPASPGAATDPIPS